jgi:transcription antitermination protein NusB
MRQTGPRRIAREYALRELYADNILTKVGIEALPPVLNWWEVDDNLSVNREANEFARKMIDGVSTHLEEIDQLITQHARNWRIERMAIVDKNLLRISIWEILKTPETPVSVILNESIELAKCYGDDNSVKFINGILDSLAKKARSNPA